MVESECDFDADDRKTVELPQSVVDEGCIVVLVVQPWFSRKNM